MSVTAKTFRSLALAFDGAEERKHSGHPDFRVGGKIFATLGYPDEHWGMVKLTPEEQAAYMKLHPGAFMPANGAWGAQGSTLVRLSRVPKAVLEDALHAAWDLRRNLR